MNALRPIELTTVRRAKELIDPGLKMSTLRATAHRWLTMRSWRMLCRTTTPNANAMSPHSGGPTTSISGMTGPVRNGTTKT
jgi:hypothetical protein